MASSAYRSTSRGAETGLAGVVAVQRRRAFQRRAGRRAPAARGPPRRGRSTMPRNRAPVIGRADRRRRARPGVRVHAASGNHAAASADRSVSRGRTSTFRPSTRSGSLHLRLVHGRGRYTAIDAGVFRSARRGRRTPARAVAAGQRSAAGPTGGRPPIRRLCTGLWTTPVDNARAGGRTTPQDARCRRAAHPTARAAHGVDNSCGQPVPARDPPGPGPLFGTRRADAPEPAVARQASTSCRWWTTSCRKYCPSVSTVNCDPFDRVPGPVPLVVGHASRTACGRDGGRRGQLGRDDRRVLQVVAVRERGGVLVPVLERRVVLREQQLEASVEDPQHVAHVRAVLEGRPGGRRGPVPGVGTAQRRDPPRRQLAHRRRRSPALRRPRR